VPKNLNSALPELLVRLSGVSAGARVSWALLTLVAVSLATMPVTQRLWTWDGFLHGGQDFETCLFLILVSLCLLVVLARACQSCIAPFLAALQRLSPIEENSPRRACMPLSPPALLRIFLPGDGYTLPLQI